MKASGSIKALAAALAAVVLMAGGAFAQMGVPLYTITSIINNNNLQFVVAKSGVQFPAYTSIQNAIDAIKTDAGINPVSEPNPVAIQFGDGSHSLSIESETAEFTSNSFGIWEVFITGTIVSTSDSSTIKISEKVSITSEADITNDGGGYAIHNSGKLSINGGSLSVWRNSPANLNKAALTPPYIPLTYAVYHNTGFPLILGGSPDIGSEGGILLASGNIGINNTFAPASKKYRITLRDEISEGMVVVAGGAAYADNFNLRNSLWGLKASGNDLVIYDPTTSIITKNTASAKRLSIAQNGANLRIVGATQTTPIRIYSLNGKLLMSRSAMPNEVISVSNLARGTYVVKALGNSVRIVR